MNETHPTHEQLVDYLHGELPPHQDAATYAHLAGCSSCAEVRDEEAALTEVLQAHSQAEERDIPESVVAGIRDAIDRQLPSPLWVRLSAVLRPAIFVPVAAAIAFVLYLGLGQLHRPVRAATIGAAEYVNNHAALTATTPFSEDAPLPVMLTSDEATDTRSVYENR
jgi:anti-sigma factor RsiW